MQPGSSNELSPSPVHLHRLADQVIVQLRQWLDQGTIAIDEKLPTEVQLMQKFGVGRSTIREAVRALVQTGMLEVRAGDGTYLRAARPATEPLTEKLKRANVAEVFEVRRTFEMSVARLAATYATTTDLKLIEKAFQKCEDDIARNDNAAFLKSDYDFHLAIAAATKNALLIDLYGIFRKALTSGMAAELFKTPGSLKRVSELHRKLFNSLKKGDPVAAQSVWMKSPNPFISQQRQKKTKSSKKKQD